MSDSILAWHFSDGELRFDYAGVKVEAGLVLETQDKPIVEKNGFHASIRALDALRWYAVRPQKKFIISRVSLSGEMMRNHHINDTKRIVAQKREHLWVADAKIVLEEFVEEEKTRFIASYQRAIDLRLAIYPKIQDVYLQERLKKKPIELSNIALHPLANQALEFASYVLEDEMDVYYLGIWEKAISDNFDLETYLRRGAKDFNIIQWFDEMNDYESVYTWAIKNPPQEYAKFFDKPKDPNELLHQMLMRLTPEGYKE